MNAADNIIAIIRGFAPETCLRLTEAYARGGITKVEVTFNQKNPSSWKDTTTAIAAMRQRFGGTLRIGAGTVLTLEQLKLAQDAGSEFAVAPICNVELIRECVKRSIIAISGAMTPSEAVAGYDAGAKFVKLFPAGSLGIGYIKALVAPLSHIPFLAFSGIVPENIADFIKAGCVGAGISGCLTNKEWITTGAWDKIEAVARQIVENARAASV